MRLITDSREQAALRFPKMSTVEYLTQALPAGDYGAEHASGQVWLKDEIVFERKGLGDLFTSFTSGYDREKAKWQRAQALGQTYILAIEGTITDVLKGHEYWAGGELHISKKSGLAMLRQLCTLQRKYGLQVMFFASRVEMALYIQEYFLSAERAGGSLGCLPQTPTVVGGGGI